MRIVKGVLGVLAAVAVSAVVTAYAGLNFLIGSCHAFDDTGGPFPANDSPQGRVCGYSDHASWLDAMAPWSIPAAGLLAVLVAVVAWRRSIAGRWLAALALLLLPFVPLMALTAPADTCSADVARQAASECETTG